MGAPVQKVPIIDTEDKTAEKCIKLFKEKYGSAPQIVGCAPGRVNLIGEHTDYQEGYVFPMALDLKTIVCASKTDKNKICIYSEDKGAVEWSSLPTDPPAKPEWWSYVVGAIHMYCECMKVPAPTSLDMAVITTVPLGAGLSSSAALEVATFTAMEGLNKRYADPIDKAEACQKAEHVWAKMPCGLMDQAISTLGQKGMAMMFDCKSKKPTYAPIPPTVRVIVVDSGVKHQLVDGHYKKRKDKCQEAVDYIKKTDASVKSLRDVSPELLEKCKSMDAEAYKRASHVIQECIRCEKFQAELSNGGLEAAGQIMYAGHKSLSEVYDVSVPEIDQIVKIASGIDGVYGARLTGGGFGGSVVVLVKADKADGVAKDVLTKYKEYLGSKEHKDYVEKHKDGVLRMDPKAMIVSASDGAHIYAKAQ